MKKELLSLAFILLLFTQLSAGLFGPDAGGYFYRDSLSVNWIDITGNGTRLTGLADDNSVGPFNLGFNFSYYGTNYNSIKVGTNGWVSFSNIGNINHCFPPIPTPGGNGDAYLAPMMSDLNFTGNAGEIWFYTNNTDSAVISYLNAPFWVNAVPDYTGGATFQVILSARDSSIVFQYDTVNTGNWSLSSTCAADVVVGIESPGGTTGHQVNLDTLPNFGQAIRFGPSVRGINQISGNVFLDYNGNGIKDAGDYDLPNIRLDIQGQNYQVFSGSDGDYFAFVDTGAFTVSPILPFFATGSLPASRTVNFTSFNNSDSLNNFAIQTGPPQQDLEVSLVPVGAPIRGRAQQWILSAKNNGNTVESDTLHLDFDPRLTYLSANPSPVSASNNPLSFPFVNLLPGQSFTVVIDLEVSLNAMMGDTIANFAQVGPLSNELILENNYTQWSDVVLASYDPNDKRVQPASLPPSAMQNRPWLTYTIRFQNTGTAPAFRVELRDTFPNELDLSTLQMIDASHDYSLELRAQNASWLFDPILLPDSNANEPESHGFVRFKVRPVAGLVLNDSIRNRAGIYFDFNEPVITNWSVFKVDTIFTGIPEILPVDLVTYPVPVGEKLFVEGIPIDLKITEVRVYGVDGRSIYPHWQTDSANRLLVDSGELPAGVWFLKVETDKGIIPTKKLMKH